MVAFVGEDRLEPLKQACCGVVAHDLAVDVGAEVVDVGVCDCQVGCGVDAERLDPSCRRVAQGLVVHKSVCCPIKSIQHAEHMCWRCGVDPVAADSEKEVGVDVEAGGVDGAVGSQVLEWCELIGRCVEGTLAA